MRLRWWRSRKDLDALSALVLGPERDMRMGLTITERRFVYVLGAGFGRTWLSPRIMSIVAICWNRLVCLTDNHSQGRWVYDNATLTGTPKKGKVCTLCCKKWPK